MALVSEKQQEFMKEMIEAVNTCLKHKQLKLTEWEENFIISIEEQLEANRRFTDKQFNRLEQIYDRT